MKSLFKEYRVIETGLKRGNNRIRLILRLRKQLTSHYMKIGNFKK